MPTPTATMTGQEKSAMIQRVIRPLGVEHGTQANLNHLSGMSVASGCEAALTSGHGLCAGMDIECGLVWALTVSSDRLSLTAIVGWSTLHDKLQWFKFAFAKRPDIFFGTILKVIDGNMVFNAYTTLMGKPACVGYHPKN
jgi:hypothetical protein